MIINNTYKFIFVHIPKNAGTSLTKFFSQFTNWRDIEIGATRYGIMCQKVYRERFGLGKHSTIKEIAKVVGEEVYKTYYKFAFVRNPYARTYSIYNFLKKWDGLPTKWREIINQFSSFEEFVLSGILKKEKGPDRLFMPQVFWVEYGDTMGVDFIGKVEYLERDLEKLLNFLDLSISDIEIPRLNVSTTSINEQDFSNPKVIDFIYQNYRKDFETFNYSKDVNEVLIREA